MILTRFLFIAAAHGKPRASGDDPDAVLGQMVPSA